MSEAPVEDRKGGVEQRWLIYCGVCGREDLSDGKNQRQFLQTRRDAGWVRNRRHGWVCPDDAKRLGLNSRGVRPHPSER